MSNCNSSRKEATQGIDEVEELLRAAQDDLLLKLSLNSHIARSGPSSEASSTIDPDLDRRFEALKSKPKLSTTSRIESDKKNPEKVVDNIDESDSLFARFAALKNSLPSYSSSSVSAIGVDQRTMGGEENESADEEDEVEKVINWAIDAARLDPSPPSDVDVDAHADEDEDDSDSEKDSDDANNREADTRKKNKRK